MVYKLYGSKLIIVRGYNLSGKTILYTESRNISPSSFGCGKASCSSTEITGPMPMRAGFPFLLSTSLGRRVVLTVLLMRPEEVGIAVKETDGQHGNLHFLYQTDGRLLPFAVGDAEAFDVEVGNSPSGKQA